MIETAEILYVAQALMRDHPLENVPVCELAYRMYSPLTPAEMLEAAKLPGGVLAKEWAWRERRLKGMAGHGRTVKAPVVACYLNQGRWLLRCPFCETADSIQHASETDHRFLCHRCSNTPVAGAYLHVSWPVVRTDVEELVAGRPTPAQNWEPGDPLADLAAANTANGA